MKTSMKRAVVISAVASMFAVGATAAAAGRDGGGAAEKTGKDKSASVPCAGVNECKGKSSCSTATNSCSGMNGCKGKGRIEVKSEKECKDRGGTVVRAEK